MEIRSPFLAEWDSMRKIYIEGIRTGNATFETESDIKNGVAWFASKIKGSILVAQEDSIIVGWATLSAVSERCVYSGVAEISVYVAGNHQGKGIGSNLLQKLIEFAENNNIWTLQAGVFAENVSSRKLLEKYGFRIVGRREKLGKLNDIWRDVLLMERRSKTIF